jgi:hypothetical protein
MPAQREALRALFLLVTSLAASGCGGGMPLLHPAHTLRPGQVSGSVGASGNFLLGDADAAIERTDAAGAGNSLGANESQHTTEGIAAAVLGAPGVAPYVAGRVGVAERTEAGLAYSGRSVRIDGRHAFEDASKAFSAGLGLRALLSHPTSSPEGSPPSGELSGVDASGVTGFGADLPLLVGYRSDADLVQLWGGLRGSYELISGELLFTAPLASAEMAELDATKFSAEALIGLGVGLSPIWVAVEVSAGYVHMDGELRPEGLPSAAGKVDGVTVTPAGAITGRF